MDAVIPRSEIDTLIHALLQRGYKVIGPVVRDGAIAYDELRGMRDLPAGWTDEQEGGHYRLKRRNDEALFGYNVGPHSWKNFLHPSHIRLWTATQQEGPFRILDEAERPKQPYAFLGVRACDLKAIAAQDRILLHDKYRDPIYNDRRVGVFIVAVQCTQAAATCFCASMKTGPRAEKGFDLALTELDNEFLVEVGTDVGREVLAQLQHREASDDLRQSAEAAVRRAAEQQKRHLDTNGIQELLYRNFEHPRWDDVAARCLTCGNCTMVCPTCFCTTVEDVTDVTGDHAERWRRWDSCFTTAFSHLHGGSVRRSAKGRYRQWMTHKLASWIDQFGESGCVGCGRCITWCPVGIDITEEVAAHREEQG
jgi:ferredoxin